MWKPGPNLGAPSPLSEQEEPPSFGVFLRTTATTTATERPRATELSAGLDRDGVQLPLDARTSTGLQHVRGTAWEGER